MEIFIMLSSFIIATILSTVIHFKYPKLPLAFIQIFLGLLIYITPLPIVMEFEPEMFLIGIIAPLLFLEGNHVSRIRLLKYIKPVVLMAIGLVFTTVIGLGYIVHFLMPLIPFAACFALAAIICPTDAVAVQAIAKGKKLPKGLMTILEGESLLNDAAGILSFNIAVVALTAHVFTIQRAALQFFASSLGGIAVGLIIGILFVQIRIRLLDGGFEEEYIFSLIQLLTPFVIYMVAETFHVSGIIAAVVGGIIHGIERDRFSQATTKLQMGYNYTWGLLSTILNGMVFTILGYIIPEVTIEILKNEQQNLGGLILLTIVVSLLVYLFRFLWVFVLYDMFYLPVNPFIKILNNQNASEPEERPSRFKYALITTVCGVHGTISMAIALTLPYEIFNHQPFMFRDDLLFIAAGVVLISLIVAQLLLPLLTEEEVVQTSSNYSFKEARVLVIEKGIEYLHRHTTKENMAITGNLIRENTMRINFYKRIHDLDENPKEMLRLQNKALDIEAKVLEELTENGTISETVYQNYVAYIERTRLFAHASFVKRALFLLKVRRNRHKLKKRFSGMSPYTFRSHLMEIEKVAGKVHYAVLQGLLKEQNAGNRMEVAMVTDIYLNRVQQLKRNIMNEKLEDAETLLALNVIGIEREIVQELAMKEKISSEVAIELRQSLNYDEMILLDNHS
ncbi:sodium:proton antiporter [Macrococcus hajekii]|uniref:Sodium:proton antiporter n=1 Tax=Macrococcus hajekii TaxID=198482 RepID=A0A4R6BJ62_9STAP|nr:sodium:proton antiporter [Macrococcus hajekii]TDM01541.1 sodium:proton antiporter [Macrococcus hajekii]GGB00871.1 sodium:proton antiporter [Macrococcus hajekii]